MLLRKLGSLILGKATPFQIIAASILGATLGFMPLPQAAGSIFVLGLLLIILNANLVMAALTVIVAKLFSLPLLPVTFFVGRLLLDGPLGGLFAALINAPGTALLGLEYYVVAGAYVIGPLVGLATGLGLVRGLTRLRRRLADLEEGSDRYQRFMSRWWVPPLLFLLLGVRKGKKWSYRALLEKRVGLPVRPLGMAAAVLAVLVVGLLIQFASEPIVRMALQSGLERANGATVDIRSAELDVSENKLVLTGFAMADPNDLGSDLIRAERIEADIGGLELLRKRMVLDRVVLSETRHAAPRKVPGRHVGPPPEPDEPFEIPSNEQLEEYIRTAQEWKERLSQVREWIEDLSRSDDQQSLPQRVEQRVRDRGYAAVKASHLIEGSPTMLVRELRAEKMQSDELPDGETVDVVGTNLSTHPARHPEPPHIEIRSSGNTIDATAHLAGAVNPAGRNDVRIALRGLSVDSIGRQWQSQPPPMQGGTLDVNADLAFTGAGGDLDFPLRVTLHNTVLSLGDLGSRPIDTFDLPVRVRGSIDQPRITVDSDTLAQSLADAGAAELASKVRGEVDEKVEDLKKDVGERLGEKAGKALQDLFGGADEKK